MSHTFLCRQERDVSLGCCCSKNSDTPFSFWAHSHCTARGADHRSDKTHALKLERQFEDREQG